MGCTSSINSEASPPKRKELYTKNFRNLTTLSDCLTFNSISGLFLGVNKIDSTAFFVRFVDCMNKSDVPLRNKIEILCNYQSKFCYLLPYECVSKTIHYFYLAMSDWRCCNLLEAIAAGIFKVTEANLRIAFKGVFETLNKMHDSGLVHGQISPFKLIYKEKALYLFDMATGIESTSDLMSEYLCYLAPEILMGEEPCSKSDVWAMGGVIYYLITGSTVYPPCAPTEYARLAISNEPFFDTRVWKEHSPELLDMIKSMLKSNKDRRFTMKEVVESSWVKALGYTDFGITRDHSYLIKSELEIYNVMTKLSYILGNEKPIEELNSIRASIVSINPGRLEAISLRYLMNTSGLLNHQFLTDPKYEVTQVNYVIALSNAQNLRKLIIQERLAMLFYKLADSNGLLTADKLSVLLSKLGMSLLYDNMENFKVMIKERQIEKRREANLNFIEFIRYYDSLTTNFPESFLEESDF